MIERLSSLALVPGCLAALVCLAPKPVDELGKSDRRKLSKAFATYFEADDTEKLEAREDLAQAIAKIDEKADRPVLAEVAQLQEILVESRDRESRVDGKGNPEEVEVKRGPVDTTAVVRAPKKYKGDAPYPLVMVIPDAGQSPEEALRQDWNQADAIEEAVFCAVTMPDRESDWVGFGDGTPGGVFHVMSAYGQMIERYQIHPDQVYLAGRGLGVEVAADLAATFPDRFAAVVGHAGDVGSTSADNFGSIATLWIGGGAKAAEFEQGAKELGFDNCTNAPNMTPAEVWAWLSEQRRTAHPAKIVFRPRHEQAFDAYWLRLIGLDMSGDGPSVEAVVDAGSNTITIDGEGVSSVLVRVNDALVDLSRPVKVVLNGVEVERQFDRNLAFMLERIRTSADPARIYVADSTYDF